MRGIALPFGLLLALVVGGASAQTLPADSTPTAQAPPWIRVRVRQVAGNSLYLDVGTRHGLAAGDTLGAARDSAGPELGRLVVTAISETRAVLAPAAGALSLASGDSIALLLRRAPPALAAAEAPVAPAASLEARAIPDRRPYGRFALELAAGQYQSRYGGAQAFDRGHGSATPAFRLDLTVPDVGAGFRLRTGARLAYRHDASALAGPATSLRVYSAAIERDLPGSTFRMALGRFHSPAESYSGFWDGVHVRLGRSFGVGVLAGFQPDLWNERPSMERPKVSVVLDGERRGRVWRWSGDASAHRVWGGDLLPTRSFVGLSQSLSGHALRIGHDVQVEQDPEDGGWRLARATVRGSVSLGRGVDLRAAFARRAPYLEFARAPRFADPRDRLSGGLALSAAGSRFSVDVSRMTDRLGAAHAYSAYFTAPPWLPGGARLEGSASYWQGTSGTSLFAAPGVSLVLGSAALRLGYRYDRSDFLDRLVETHGAELSGDVGVGRAARASVRLRGQTGDSMRSAVVDLSLYRAF